MSKKDDNESSTSESRPSTPPPAPRPPAGPAPSSPPAGPRLEHNIGVRNADHYTSLVDTFVASQLRSGFQPHQLDRNGRLLVAATSQES